MHTPSRVDVEYIDTDTDVIDMLPGADGRSSIELHLDHGILAYSIGRKDTISDKEWNGLIVSRPMPPRRPQDMNRLLDAIAPHAQTILNDSESADADNAVRQIDELIEDDEDNELRQIDASDWYPSGGPDALTAHTSDDELERIADELDEESRNENQIVWGTRTWLVKQRDELISETVAQYLERIEELAKQVHTAVEQRNSVIVEAKHFGISLRDVAGAAGLSHQTIANIDIPATVGGDADNSANTV